MKTEAFARLVAAAADPYFGVVRVSRIDIDELIAYVKTQASESEKLIEFFRKEGGHLAQQGDDYGWSPADTAIKAMRELQKLVKYPTLSQLDEPIKRETPAETFARCAAEQSARKKQRPDYLVRGETYTHKDGRKGVLLGSHPHDGALLVFNEVDRADDEIMEFFACERSDLFDAPVPNETRRFQVLPGMFDGPVARFTPELRAALASALMASIVRTLPYGKQVDRLVDVCERIVTAVPVKTDKAVDEIALSDGAVLVKEGKGWTLARDGGAIRYLNRFENGFVNAALAAAAGCAPRAKQFDPALLSRIPQYVIDAEMAVSKWFAANNISAWQLGESQSRDDGSLAYFGEAAEEGKTTRAGQILNLAERLPVVLAHVPRVTDDGGAQAKSAFDPELQSRDGVFHKMPSMGDVAVNMASHQLYTDKDKDRPDVICDRNGQVALGLCKVCGKGEAELEEPCDGHFYDWPLWLKGFVLNVEEDLVRLREWIKTNSESPYLYRIANSIQTGSDRARKYMTETAFGTLVGQAGIGGRDVRWHVPVEHGTKLYLLPVKPAEIDD